MDKQSAWNAVFFYVEICKKLHTTNVTHFLKRKEFDALCPKAHRRLKQP
jgi:hypothetical protein